MAPILRNLLFALLIVIAWSAPVLSQQRQLRRPKAAAQRPLEDMVEGFYVSQFPQQVGVNDEQYVRILPSLRQVLRERRDISARKQRAVNQLRQVLQRGDSEEEIKRLVAEIDRADMDIQASQKRFTDSVDPLLNSQQQAKLRLFQFAIDRRIRQMIDRAQAPRAVPSNQP